MFCRIFQALTTAIETVPPQGTLGLNATVSGVSQAAGAAGGETWNTGDTINGGGAAAANIINLLGNGQTAVGGEVVTVNNVNRINTNLVANTALNASQWTGVGQSWIENTAAAGNTATLINGELATVYGANATSLNTVYNIGIRAGDLAGANDTLKIALNNAGNTIKQAGVAPINNVVTINAASAGIETVKVDATGTNVIAITGAPAAGVATDYAKLVVTGNGINTINVAGFSVNALNFDMSASTGTNTLNFGNNGLLSNAVVLGGTGADTVRVDQSNVIAGVSFTGVETLRSSVGVASASTGTIAFASANLQTLQIDGDAAEAGRLTLINPGSITKLNFVGDGLTANAAVVEQFKAATVTGAFSGASDALAINFTNGGTANSAGYTVAGNTIVNGVETVTVTEADVGAASVLTFAGIQSNTLQTIKFTSAGAVNTGVIDAAPVGGNSALSLIDLSGVTGTVASTISTDGVASIGAATQVLGATGPGGTNYTTGAQAAGDSILYTGGIGNDAITARDALGNPFLGTLVANGGGGTNNFNVGDTTVGAVASTSIITVNTAGSTNTVTGGTGADTITINATAAGTINTVIGNAGADVINASGSTVSVIIFGGDGADVITAGAGVDTLRYGSGATGTGALTTALITSQDGDTINSFQGAGIDKLAFGTLTGTTGFVQGTAAVAGETLITATTAGNNVNFVTNATGASLSAQATFVYNTATNVLTYDADGTGAGAAAQTIGTFVGLSGALTAADFLIA